MESIIEQLCSKKFRGMLIGIAGVIAVQMGFDPAVAEKLIPWLSGIVIAYITGQGLADFGKAKGEVDLMSVWTAATGAGKALVRDGDVSAEKIVETAVAVAAELKDENPEA